MRGRPFGFVVIVCATWVAARIGFTLLADGQVQVGGGHTGIVSTQSIPVAKSESPKVSRKQDSGTLPRAAEFQSPLMRRVAVQRKEQPHPYNLANLIDAKPERYSAELKPLPTIAPIQFKHPTKVRPIRPIEIYAYSFLRYGTATPGVLGTRQYGGSQSALLLRIPLLRLPINRSMSRLALTGRASIGHDDPSEREFAAGLQWRPSASLPAQFALERRFRPDRNDAFAGFVAGGHDRAALPLGFALDAYGQAGFVTGKDGGSFADVQMHALKPVIALRRASLAAGAGTWGGGQSQIMRLDFGPSVRAELQSGSAHFRLDASWRFRIAGNARPGNGPAVTLSTSF